MNLVEKAQMTLNYVSSNGIMNEAQAGTFIDLLCAPFPPVRYTGIRGILTYPLYLYRTLRFKKINKRWEAASGRINPYRNGFVISRIKKNELEKIKWSK